MLDGPEHHSNHHTMMNCTDVREKLALYVGNDLDQESQRFVGAHLALCESCAREARSAERAREVLVSSFAPGPADLRTDLWDAIRAELLAEGRLSGAPGTPAGVAENPSVPGAAASRKSTGGTANLRPVAARPGPRP
ncbi:MAG TPA: zf-HC2 domain-containing protein, partial [Planctomycetes bacterium]|nr:zf-HC2 domain-containing protein [Planctomycetota bacterium]